MKKLTLTLSLVVVTAGILCAQYNFADATFNATLVKIDDDATLNFTAFKTDVSLSYNVEEKKITSWSVDFGMKAGEIYLALEIAKITKKPIEEVIKVYQTNKTKGWGVIAKELGIKPGSPEFHALKNGADSRSKKTKSNSEKGKPKGKN